MCPEFATTICLQHDVRMAWQSGIGVKAVVGSDAAPYLPALAELRVFREFPYLYEGDEDAERAYLQTYMGSKELLLVLVLDNDRIVGASSALPLRDETEEIRAPFERSRMDVSTFLYLGESVLESQYRGQGIGARLFEFREAYARALGLTWTTFCAVERMANDFRRPPAYRPLDDFWHRRGYEKHPELSTTMFWHEIEQSQATAQKMIFWLKRLI